MRIVFRYLFVQFLKIFAALAAVIFFVIFLAEFITIFKDLGTKADLSMTQACVLALSRAPESFFLAIPHAMFLSGLYGFWRLFRYHEWTVLRNSGLNFWQIVAGYACAAGGLSVLMTTLLQPVFAEIRQSMYMIEYEKNSLESKLSLGSTGLWLSQKRDSGYMIVHAQKINILEKELISPSVIAFSPDNQLLYQLEGQNAHLDPEVLKMTSVWKFMPDGTKQFFAEYALPSHLNVEVLERSINLPHEVSFWELPNFIKTLELSGFQTAKYKIQFFKMMFEPFMSVALIFLAMALSKSQPRRYDAIKTLGVAVLVLIAVTVIQDIFHAQGTYQRLPVILAAAIVPVIVGLSSIVAMMQAEEK